MIIIDANLLLYAYNSSASLYASARSWLEDIISRPEPFGIPWVTALAFLRISTNARAFPAPFSSLEATSIISEILKQPASFIPQPGEHHWKILSELLITAQVTGPLVSDAHLAALALEHGATLMSTDRDFSRFPGLKFRNPLVLPEQ